MKLGSKACLVPALLLLTGVATATISYQHGIAPPSAKVAGKTYAEWSASWWQWALALPAQPGHPFFDDDQFDVTAGQTGKVWFLAAPVTGAPVERTVTIPPGTRLFVPMANIEASNLEAPPFYGGTEVEQRAAAKDFADLIVAPFCEIDGASVDHVERYRFSSPQFTITLPDPNVYGLPAGSGTSVSDGYWAMIGPLSAGDHEIHFGGEFVGTVFGDIPIDMTYHVTVQ
ncbi:MAG: hypothetical protein ABL998_14685 [Planctomycetota bacterium]